jgi:hypothetical protein
MARGRASAYPPPDIPDMVRAFMDSEVCPGVKMREYLYLALPEALDHSVRDYHDACAAQLGELHDISGDERLKHLKLEDGSLDRAAEWLEQEFYEKPHAFCQDFKHPDMMRILNDAGGDFEMAKVRYEEAYAPYENAMDLMQAHMGLDIRRRGYHAGGQRRAFLKEQLLPLLKRLEAGEPPLREDMLELGSALRTSPPELVSLAEGLFYYYDIPGERGVPAEGVATPADPKKTRKDIIGFLSGLYHTVQQHLGESPGGHDAGMGL